MPCRAARVDTYNALGLSLEDSFNRNSIPICQQPYGAPIFMGVIDGDIRSVYSIVAQGMGSPWDHDPYGLGLLYVGA